MSRAYSGSNLEPGRLLPTLAAAAALFAAGAGAARSDGPAPTPVLPDLRQVPPSSVQIAQIGSEWRLGFGSKVVNDGPGYLKITGSGTGDGTMVAEQDVQVSDGSESVAPGIGSMQYVIATGHQHFHLLDFERYELRAAADPTTPVVTDQKTGFCLADDFTTDLCGRNQPNLTTVTEGISVGGSDTYLGYLEGQSLLLDPATTPAGDYILVNRVNPTGALQEGRADNDAASVRLTLSWSAGKPSMKVTNTCASANCPAPPPPPAPDPQPSPPQPQEPVPPAAGQPDVQSPAPEPEPVPVVPAAAWQAPAQTVTMSRAMARRLARRAIVAASGHAPRTLRANCARLALDSFSCTTAWHAPRGVHWRGRVRVWYRLHEGTLDWLYDLKATPHPRGRPLVSRSATGGTSRVVFATAAGRLLLPAD